MKTIIHKGFLKECKYIEKRVTRHITDDLESSFDDSDEGQIKNKCQDNNVFFEGAILKIYFLREQF